MAANSKGYHKKVIRITAMDSPSVRLGLYQKAKGLPDTGLLPDGRPVLEGVLSYAEYKKRRVTWDPVRQTIGLDAQFYKGKEVLLYPPDRLDRGERFATMLTALGTRRKAGALGVDPAEGGDSTSYTVIDRLGIIEMVTEKTPDTDRVFQKVKELINRYKIAHDRVVIDRGGGGKQHADRLRKEGYKVRTVAFGESPTGPILPRTTLGDRREDKEDRTTFVNRRAEMYWTAAQLFDPQSSIMSNGTEYAYVGIPLEGTETCAFGLPADCYELRRQLALMPLRYDAEGRIYLPPKDKKPGTNVECLKDLIGHSPDEADSFVCAVYALLSNPGTIRAGGISN